MKRAPKNDVEAYLARRPPKVRAILRKLRSAIKSAAPRAEELISYRIPAFRLHDRMLIFFAGFKDHCSLFVPNKQIVKSFARELKPFDVHGATIRFSIAKPPSATLVRRIVKTKAADNERRARRKKG
jgi:uncharacterized protein YdhG (YjbR/CyaY superfamily)